MLSLSTCKKKLAYFKSTCGEKYGIIRNGIFGSVASGEQKQSSDLDIVVDIANPTWRAMAEIKEQLETLFCCTVDLVRYRKSLRPLLKDNIDKDVIYV